MVVVVYLIEILGSLPSATRLSLPIGTKCLACLEIPPTRRLL